MPAPPPPRLAPQLVTLERDHLMVVSHSTNDGTPTVLTTQTSGDDVWRPCSLSDDGWDFDAEYGAVVQTMSAARLCIYSSVLLCRVLLL